MRTNSCARFHLSAENFDALADLIASYPVILRSTHFVFVPGPLDVTVNAVLPKRTLLSSLTGKLKSKIPKVHFATNPARIKFFNQEILVFREDVMSRMLRNTLCVKPNVKGDTLKRFVGICFGIVLILLILHPSACAINARSRPSEPFHD
jgi:hypothetical protein